MLPNENNLKGKDRISYLCGYIDGTAKGIKYWIDSPVNEVERKKYISERVDLIIEAQDEIFKVMQAELK
jgi:hypothetical protein